MVFAAAGSEAYAELRPLVSSGALTITAAGALALHHDFTELTRRDVNRAELVILPVVPVLLLVVFGSVVAAIVPFGVGLLAVAGGMASTFLLARVTSVSVYAPNVVTMIGLAVAIDYSLFIVSRYREEVRRRPAAEALGQTLATAGAAILFSGPHRRRGAARPVLPAPRQPRLGRALRHRGRGVRRALRADVPARTAGGPRAVDRRAGGCRGCARTARPERPALWVRLTAVVMAHPWRVLLPVTALLLLLGAPFARIRLAASDIGVLPSRVESRRGEDLLRREFPGQDTTRLVLVLDWGERSPRGAPQIAEMHRLSRWLARQPDVAPHRQLRGHRPVDLAVAVPDARGHASRARARLAIQAALDRTMGRHVALMIVHTPQAANSDAARLLVERIRRDHPRGAVRLLVTGHSAFDVDFLALVRDPCPAGGGGHRRRHLPGAVRAARLGPAARQGRRHQLPVDQRLVRGAGVDLPGRPPRRLARVHAGAHRDVHAARSCSA